MGQPTHGIFLPKKFFVTSGSANSPTSALNAFDAALMKAGIAQCNLVCVSSILPADAEFIKNCEITPGTVTFSVLARMDGDPGETIGAGLGWAWGVTLDGQKYGLVAEAHGYKDREAIERELKWKLQEMAKIRQLQITSIECKLECLEVPKGRYGSVVVALIYVPWEQADSQRQPNAEREYRRTVVSESPIINHQKVAMTD
ncbi:MAG: pyruvoyl-dependent arginine decarboxylase [Candidatus Bathyarchaeia archaeon]